MEKLKAFGKYLIQNPRVPVLVVAGAVQYLSYMGIIVPDQYVDFATKAAGSLALLLTWVKSEQGKLF